MVKKTRIICSILWNDDENDEIHDYKDNDDKGCA